jgi:cell division protein FtsB
MALVFVGCVLLFDALVGDKGLVDMMRAREEQRTLQRTLAEALRDNDRLREDIRRLKEEPAAIEELARRELGLIKPGEKLFVIRDIEPRDPEAP